MLQKVGGCCNVSSKSPASNIHTVTMLGPSHPIESLSHQLSLPPILEPLAFLDNTPPLFPDIPPLKTFLSLAGTGCTCGLECSCPGCVEHRGPDHASNSHPDCSDDCRYCVDGQQGIELPASTGYGSANIPSVSAVNTTFIDALIARAAAAIPPPPTSRASLPGVSLDPTNVTVYPQSLFADEGKRLDEQGPSIGAQI